MKIENEIKENKILCLSKEFILFHKDNSSSNNNNNNSLSSIQKDKENINAALASKKRKFLFSSPTLFHDTDKTNEKSFIKDIKETNDDDTDTNQYQLQIKKLKK